MTSPSRPSNSHVVKMKSLHADVFVDITGPKFAAQAIRKAAEIGWKPIHFLNSVSSSNRRRHQAGRSRKFAGYHFGGCSEWIHSIRNGRTTLA